MKLNAGRRGENRGFSIGILRVERRHALLDIGFENSRDAQLARVKTLRNTQLQQPRLHFGFHQRAQLLRHSGQQHDDVPARFQPQVPARSRADFSGPSRPR